jgi:NitT/TauT family transport system substrate-binding protein
MLRRPGLVHRAIAFACLVAALIVVVSPAAHAQSKELRIGVQYGLGYLPLYVARDAGLFEKHMKMQGLAPVPVRIVNFTGGPQIQDGLLSQTLDIGAGGVTVLLITRDKSRGGGDQEMLGLSALRTVDSRCRSQVSAWSQSK